MLQEAKHGWIQYLAFLLPMWYAASFLQDFLFDNRVVVAAAVDDVMRKTHTG